MSKKILKLFKKKFDLLRAGVLKSMFKVKNDTLSQAGN